MRLKDGTAWPMPIILQRHAEQISHLRIGSKVLLEDSSKNQIAVLDLESIFEIDLRRAAQQWFGTTDETHPGVERLLRRGNCVLGGKIHLLSRSTNNHKQFELTPAQTRKIFEARGWRKVVGFHTRNPIHRAHEFIQRQALEHHQCDGMLIQPVVGPKLSLIHI